MVAAAAASPTPSSRIDASFDSDDFSNNNGGGRDREVDLSQLFSDVSKTVGNLKNILTTNRESLGGIVGSDSEINQSSGTSSRLNSASNILNDIMGSRDDQPGPIAKLFSGSSGVCFKTCGFEDIQAAARRAGELFFTMKVCLIILTFVAVLCFLAITVAVLFYIYKNRHTLRQLASSNSVSDDGNISVTPLIFSKRTQPLLSNNAANNNGPPPKPPAHATTIHSGNQQKHSPVSNSSSSD
uniref:Uncharacterized protein n=1 Tax=Panagrolaimus sp. PS1159 TaxID=55785 RepID=A0AC35F5A7_9BILA